MSDNQTFLRFEVARRIEHAVLILSFSTLAITGLAQKYPLSPISQGIIVLFGGIELTRIIHRIAATLFLFESIYHLVVAAYKLYVKRLDAGMLPGVKDAIDAIQMVGYNLGLRKEAPKMGRYNFVEKAEYWAMVWGLVVMALTGFMLWNPLATAKFLPGQFIPAAKAAHGAEAVLAVLAIILWHFYSVHLKHWNWSMIKGTLSREVMEEEHGLELEQAETRAASLDIEPATYKRRMRIFVPVAALTSLALSAAVFYFVTMERTAITTVAPAAEQVQIYSPQTPTPVPTESTDNTGAAVPTPEANAAAAATTWDGGINQLFKDNCGACHGSSGGLSVSSYADLMKGGEQGAVIKPGDAAGSLLIQTVTGQHPGSFSPEALAQIEAWINAGAPEK